ncbi:helix-turn-helix domain-containing protein [Periweissella fabalis]|uniref:Helix-turn-helix domain-containing protein n=1 Tax=Periweissella fabalis TaxID=1070421 RepID=A0A7X6N1B3_9LACO|nr:XRE family transcriptional regulator [Periweissella fabalis]MCM0599145.1 helix-turn-helix transcriptional regulator [Periweissella fabalis]NKZ23424.1 helix-turn-helix domain-containing protein [Periweissella fabalis]
MITEIVGNRLADIRRQRDLTLQEASTLTGVSSATLNNIERHTTSPSIDTLWKISSGLAVPINYFFATDKVDFELANPTDFHEITSNDPAVAVQSVFSTLVSSNFEVFHLTLAPQAQRQSAAHVPGTTEMLIVETGTLTVMINEQPHVIYAGSMAKFNGTFAHAYHNMAATPTTFISLMIYER